ncbi:MAG: lipopolysaccharide export system protein LptC [Candidatus Azotimanducaceae bacterium]
MTVGRALAILLLTSAIALVSGWVIDGNDESNQLDPRAKNEPDLYMVNATIYQYDELGQPKHQIKTTRLTHYPATDITTLDMPRVKIYLEDITSPWDIESNFGRLTPKSVDKSLPNRDDEVVELWEKVFAQRTQLAGDFVNIQTEQMTVYPDKDYLESRVKVYLDDQSGRTTAGAMNAYLEQNRYEFFTNDIERVNTIFIPEVKSLPE